MRSYKTCIIGCVICLAVLVTLAVADVPSIINLQGKLADDTGAPVADGTYWIQFRIFDQVVAGTELWATDNYMEVLVEDGLFNYLLGSGYPIPHSLSDYDLLWVELQLEGSPAMTPRIELTSVMWAFGAMYADTAAFALTSGNGDDHWLVSDTVLYTARMWGLARGSSGNMLYGVREDMVNLGVACTTGTDGQSYFSIAVLGGYGNTAARSGAIIAGGANNRAEHNYSTVSGGLHNIASGDYSSISGGMDNIAGGQASAVNGGIENLAGGSYGAIGGGYGNHADGSHAAISGGENNIAGSYAFVGGGTSNQASGGNNVIGGGAFNYTDALCGAIGGGQSDTVLSEYGFIGGGIKNHAGFNTDDSAASIGGGWQNQTIGSFATIGGGYTNVAQGWGSVVGGGGQNAVSGTGTTIAGGRYNQATGAFATVSGGTDNQSLMPYAFVGGGLRNRATGLQSVVAGGFGNAAHGYNSSILGGQNDTITTNGAYSYLFGINSVLDQDSTFMVDMPHIHFGDGATGYEFPTTDGTAGQVMATDGSGRLQWTSPASGSSGWVDDGTVVRLETPTDNVGIGTSSPDAKLHVNGAMRLGSGSREFEIFEALATDPAPWSDFILYDGIAIGSEDGGNQQMFIFADGQNQNNIFTVATSQNTGSTWEADFVIEQDGDVGIGVINPSASLEVNGMIHSHVDGFKFPDGSVQTTAAGTGIHWSLVGNIVETFDSYGITRGNANNHLYGTGVGTMINLGVACTTGASGFDYLYATVSGGEGNTAAGTAASVSGGQDNNVIGAHATISGGRNNFIGTTAATIGGGEDNRATGVHSTVAGGSDNLAMGWLSTVGGGEADTAKGKYCTVAGGHANYAGGETDSASSVGGGYNNSASNDGATVSGGENNTASGQYSTVSGGMNNTASELGSTISGGHDNEVSGANAVVCGGAGNTTAAQRSVILGGINNELTAAADFSVAFGSQIYIENPRRVVFYDGLNSGRLGLNRDDGNGGIDYPIHVGTGTSNGNGAHLTAGGTWTNGSSRTFKEDFQSIESEELLAKIAALPIESWNYKNTTERHIGPVAEDFVAAFDVGTSNDDGSRDNKYLATGDVAGVALLGVQELLKQNEELRRTIEEMKREIDALKLRDRR